MLGEWRLGVGKSTGGAILLVSVVLAGALVFTGWQIGQTRNEGPLLVNRGPVRQGPTVWPTASEPGGERAEQGAIAPGPPPESVQPTASPSPTRPRRPVPVPTGRWAGPASITVTGQELGCRAVTKTFRMPATLRIEAPLPGDDNAVRITLETDNPAAEGSFRLASSVASTGPRGSVGYWTLSGDGAGGFVGRLRRPASAPVQQAGELDNLLFATRGLDDQCGALLSAPLSYPMASGSALRLTGAGTRRSLQVTGRTSDNTRTFRIAWASL
ncbi:hypothetical protein [Cryptosporangium aurantiacum]|uniref:Uncharacterized protein n=1 Tax=Cryptosporangium aurantiacum TaxID=134849 RepID=A0A1M7Q7E1_9ACTN|nr:hypothetical protein [Cryptosporangium aurantiacum]SHN26237.1 hypothetical protein SAMN05443668_104236 [Cryptosporangium aurantiacum]